MKKDQRINWHDAAVCAMQIELRDNAQLFEFSPEFTLGKSSYRIDLLIVKKLSDVPIPKNIAKIFTTYNIFEIKGIGSSVTPDSYYKANGYAGLFIDSKGQGKGNRNKCSRKDISLSFLSTNYPRNLFKHLTKDCKLTLEKISPGVYHVYKEMYATQILVTSELPPEENLYLRCMQKHLSDTDLIRRLTHDADNHPEEEIYKRYMYHITQASKNSKGESTMAPEYIFNIFNTSSQEIAEQARKQAREEVWEEAREEEAKIYLPQINSLTENLKQANSIIANLSSELENVKGQLALYQNN